MTNKYTQDEWLKGWSEFVKEYKVLSITCEYSFRKFVHQFQAHRYGYLPPELFYRFAVLEGSKTEQTVDTVGDIFALQYWRNSFKEGFNERLHRPLS